MTRIELAVQFVRQDSNSIADLLEAMHSALIDARDALDGNATATAWLQAQHAVEDVLRTADEEL